MAHHRSLAYRPPDRSSLSSNDRDYLPPNDHPRSTRADKGPRKRNSVAVRYPDFLFSHFPSSLCLTFNSSVIDVANGRSNVLAMLGMATGVKHARRPVQVHRHVST